MNGEIGGGEVDGAEGGGGEVDVFWKGDESIGIDDFEVFSGSPRPLGEGLGDWRRNRKRALRLLKCSG